ncbi:MAG: RNA polymerase sigma factor [Solirubrobacteraceae bacterium]
MSAHRRDPRTSADRDLLDGVGQRNGAAFSVFYRRHLPAVLAYLMRETGDREQAADLAAEVFAAVLLAAEGYQPQGDSALPWVIGIARNKLLMSWRRGRVEARARLRLGLEPVQLDDQSLERVEELADLGRGRLEQMLEQLPPMEREAVLWRVVDELGYEQIADELGCSTMVIRKRVSRGLARLREQLLETGLA